MSMTIGEQLARHFASLDYDGLDEPSLGLAPLVVRDIARIVGGIHTRGVSVVLVEQNARMALRLCDHAYVMGTGRVTLSGTGQELLGNAQVQRSYLEL